MSTIKLTQKLCSFLTGAGKNITGKVVEGVQKGREGLAYIIAPKGAVVSRDVVGSLREAMEEALRLEAEQRALDERWQKVKDKVSAMSAKGE